MCRCWSCKMVHLLCHHHRSHATFLLSQVINKVFVSEFCDKMRFLWAKFVLHAFMLWMSMAFTTITSTVVYRSYSESSTHRTQTAHNWADTKLVSFSTIWFWCPSTDRHEAIELHCVFSQNNSGAGTSFGRVAVSVSVCVLMLQCFMTKFEREFIFIKRMNVEQNARWIGLGEKKKWIENIKRFVSIMVIVDMAWHFDQCCRCLQQPYTTSASKRMMRNAACTTNSFVRICDVHVCTVSEWPVVDMSAQLTATPIAIDVIDQYTMCVSFGRNIRVYATFSGGGVADECLHYDIIAIDWDSFRIRCNLAYQDSINPKLQLIYLQETICHWNKFVASIHPFTSTPNHHSNRLIFPPFVTINRHIYF